MRRHDDRERTAPAHAHRVARHVVGWVAGLALLLAACGDPESSDGSFELDDVTSGEVDGDDDGDGDEAPLERRSAGVSIQTASLPFSDGQSMGQDGDVVCQLLFWEPDALPDGVVLSVSGAAVDRATVLDGDCGDVTEAGPCTGAQVVGGERATCTLRVQLDDPGAGSRGGTLAGTLECPDDDACRRALDNPTTFEVTPQDGGSGEGTGTSPDEDGDGTGSGASTGDDTTGDEATGEDSAGDDATETEDP